MFIHEWCNGMESYRQSILIMKEFSEQQLLTYLDKISDEKLYAYNVYQIEGPGRNLLKKLKEIKTLLWVYQY